MSIIKIGETLFNLDMGTSGCVTKVGTFGNEIILFLSLKLNVKWEKTLRHIKSEFHCPLNRVNFSSCQTVQIVRPKDRY
jgi:hypothetical protein